jgi:type I restriction enzyme, S subunit
MSNTYSITNPALNPKRVFILQKSEVEKRLDPEYYGHIYNEYDKKLRLKPFKKFNQIIKSINNGFDFRDYKESGTPYLKVANIRKGEFRFDKIQYIDFNSSEITKNIQLKKGNILLTRKGTFGYSIALEQDYDFVISSEVFYIEIQEDLINPKFLEIFFNSGIGQAQFDKNKIGAIMGSLSQDAIRELKIPVPTIEVQKEIVSIYQKYISQKQTNEAEAEKLLASIDDYLLKELGITLPTPPENTLKNRMFTKTFKEISDGRIDPHFHQEKFKQLDIELSQGKFPLSKLKKKSILITSGATPLSKGDSYTEDETIGVPFVRSGEIKDITFEDCIYIKPEIHNTMLKSSQLKKGDLLIAIVGATIGEVGIYNHDREANINQAIALVRLSNELLPVFAKDFFKSAIGAFILDRAKRPVARANINLDEIGVLPIPVPPLSKQKEIADHITNIRNQAQALKDKTKDLLKKASAEIEAILLN